MNMHSFLDRQSKTVIIAMGFMAILVIGLADYLTGHKIAPSIFYLLPIFTVSWFAGKRAGIVSALLSGATLLIIELNLGYTYPHIIIPCLNVLTRLAVFLVIVFLLSRVKKLNEGLEKEVAEKTASLVIEIGEHKRAEEKIEQQNAFLEKVIESLPHPFYVIDAADYTILSANSASGLRNAVEGCTCYALTHRQDRPCSETGSLCPLEMVRQTKKAITVDHTHYDADGKPKVYEVHGAPIFDADGRVIQMIEYALDITERRLAEQAIEVLNTNLTARAVDLENANRELEAFNYTVSHDLRKPLTVINGYCQAVLEMGGSNLNERCKDYLREIYDGTLRMNELIDTLLDFSRLTHVELHPETFDLGKIAKEMAAELMMNEPERRVAFRIVDGMAVNGDAHLLRVVLENLIGNAWKYTGTREEGEIEFGMTEIEGKPAWFVRDNGVGFAMAHAEKLFIPFQRLPGTGGFKGHGIGLATVQRIIGRHGGKVWAEGEPGRGAIFYFTLPAYNERGVLKREKSDKKQLNTERPL